MSPVPVASPRATTVTDRAAAPGVPTIETPPRGDAPGSGTARAGPVDVLVAPTSSDAAQLHRLHARLCPASAGRLWVTCGPPRPRAVPGADPVVHVHGPTRHPGDAVRGYRVARRVLDEYPYRRVIGTGTGPAAPFLVEARRRGIPAHYIESITRVLQPTSSGRVLERVPGVACYSQHAGWSHRWLHPGSVFDGYTCASDERASRRPRRILVTVGPRADSPCTALARRVAAVAEPGDDVTWHGACPSDAPAPATAVARSERATLESLMAGVDIVIGHAAVDAALTALEAGKMPILVPQRGEHRGEPFDDEQAVLAAHLAALGLAVYVEVDELEPRHLERAACSRIERTEPPPFELHEPRGVPAPAGAQPRRRAIHPAA